MRLGVLDIGSNTVHLLIVDAYPGARPLPTISHKRVLKLAEHLQDDGSIDEEGVEALVRFVHEADEISKEYKTDEMLAFATSAVRESANGPDVLDRIYNETGIVLEVLSGEDEARLTFLAVRRWFGWGAGRILMLDIGGGSLEIAIGGDETPEFATSVPLGAGRLTRDWLPKDPPDRKSVRALRKYVKAEIEQVKPELERTAPADMIVGSSKTFRSLARLAGAAPSGHGPFVKRELTGADAAKWATRLEQMPAKLRSSLPGISVDRSQQVLAGAIVAENALNIIGGAHMAPPPAAVEPKKNGSTKNGKSTPNPTLIISPWALREGIILRRLDWLGHP